MPRGKKKIKPVEINDELNEDIEKEQEEITKPVTFQYVGNLKATTTMIGIIENRVPFTVSDINQINHFRNLNTFEELPEGYEIKNDEYISSKKEYSIDSENTSAAIIDESKTDGTGKEINGMIEE